MFYYSGLLVFEFNEESKSDDAGLLDLRHDLRVFVFSGPTIVFAKNSLLASRLTTGCLV